MEYKFSRELEEAIETLKKDFFRVLRLTYLDGKQEGLEVLEESLKEKDKDEIQQQL